MRDMQRMQRSWKDSFANVQHQDGIVTGEQETNLAADAMPSHSEAASNIQQDSQSPSVAALVDVQDDSLSSSAVPGVSAQPRPLQAKLFAAACSTPNSTMEVDMVSAFARAYFQAAEQHQRIARARNKQMPALVDLVRSMCLLQSTSWRCCVETNCYTGADSCHAHRSQRFMRIAQSWAHQADARVDMLCSVEPLAPAIAWPPAAFVTRSLLHVQAHRAEDCTVDTGDVLRYAATARNLAARRVRPTSKQENLGPRKVIRHGWGGIGPSPLELTAQQMRQRQSAGTGQVLAGAQLTRCKVYDVGDAYTMLSFATHIAACNRIGSCGSL